MKNLAFLFILSFAGCTTVVVYPFAPDAGSDAGIVTVEDGGDADGASASDAADTPVDSGVFCAGLPVGDMTLPVDFSANTCAGPLGLARSFTGTVAQTGDTCTLYRGTLEVVCDFTPTGLSFPVGRMYRTGLVYTSGEVMVGCEGVTYVCALTVDANTDSHRIDCTYGAFASCTIVLE